MSPQPDAAAIARLSLHNAAHFGVQHSQTLHRVLLMQHWKIPVGSKVLELGCGQGDCTTVLAHAVGDEGAVVAVDPADLDYGTFYTLAVRYRIEEQPNSYSLPLTQVPPTLSAKRSTTYPKARWVDGLLGSSKIPWSIYPPSTQQPSVKVRILI